MARVKWVYDDGPAWFSPPRETSPQASQVRPSIENENETSSSVEPRSTESSDRVHMDADLRETSWDDWVPQDRLRKLTDDNRELAASLRRDVMQADPRQHKGSKSGASTKKARAHDSDIDSARGSEDRYSSVTAGGKGNKRGRDYELEKVSQFSFGGVNKLVSLLFWLQEVAKIFYCVAS